MPEHQPQHDQNPDASTDQSGQSEQPVPPDPTTADPAATQPSSPAADDPGTPLTGGEPPDQAAASGAGGRRVTRRTVNRREVTEHTEETITEDIPLEAYQGPSSTHPAPVG